MPSAWSFKTAAFKQYIGYREGGKSRDIFTQLSDLSSYTYLYDHMPQMGKAIEVSFNTTNTMMFVKSKYFSEIYSYMKRTSGVYDKYGRKTSSGTSAYSSVVKASLFKERNVSACEVIIELCRLIERRGQLREGENAHISTLSLAERCPTLYAFIQSNRLKEGNRIFKTALYKAIALFGMYTTIDQKYIGLEIVLPEKIEVSRSCDIKIYYKKISQEDIHNGIQCNKAEQHMDAD